MRNGNCPQYGSNEILRELHIYGGEGHPPYVSIIEPEPEKRPFVWMPKSEQSHLQACVCGACGSTEMYAENYKALNEERKKGFTAGNNLH